LVSFPFSDIYVAAVASARGNDYLEVGGRLPSFILRRRPNPFFRRRTDVLVLRRGILQRFIWSLISLMREWLLGCHPPDIAHFPRVFVQ